MFASFADKVIDCDCGFVSLLCLDQRTFHTFKYHHLHSGFSSLDSFLSSTNSLKQLQQQLPLHSSTNSLNREPTQNPHNLYSTSTPTNKWPPRESSSPVPHVRSSFFFSFFFLLLLSSFFFRGFPLKISRSSFSCSCCYFSWHWPRPRS